MQKWISLIYLYLIMLNQTIKSNFASQIPPQKDSQPSIAYLKVGCFSFIMFPASFY